MKAAWFSEFGPASEVLRTGDFETPEPSHGEVFIRMHTSGVNPSDTKKRLGSFHQTYLMMVLLFQTVMVQVSLKPWGRGSSFPYRGTRVGLSGSVWTHSWQCCTICGD